MAGAVLAGADEEQTSMIEQAASDIGLAFQIQDDILDVTSTSQELGKPVHSDEKQQSYLCDSFWGIYIYRSENFLKKLWQFWTDCIIK